MTEQIGHIKNPLTVISRFAAIAEISGTAVLPFIAPENQATYIWFLMVFPVLLVGTFFLTLNFNHKTLYAPSDYKNQDHFLKLFGIVTPGERDEKLIAEVEETDIPLAKPEGAPVEDPISANDPGSSQREEGDNENDPPIPSTETTETTGNPISDSSSTVKERTFDFQGFSKRSHIELMAKIDYIERRSLEKLKFSTHIEFSPKIKFEFPKINKPILFDGIGEKGDTIHIAEIKYFENQKFSASRFGATLTNARIASQQINEVSNRKIKLHLVVVLNEPASESMQHNIKTVLINSSKNYDLDCSVYIATVDQISASGIPTGWMCT